MTDVQVTVSVQPEIQAICDGLAKEVADLKAKDPLATDLADALPLLISAAGSYAALGSDIKTAEAYAYIGLTLGKIVGSFTGAV